MSRRIRVLHLISDSYSTEYFRTIARYTDHERFQMQVGSLRSAGGLQKGLLDLSVPTFALGADRRPQYLRAVSQLVWSLRRKRIDVLHAHLFEASVVGLLAARLANIKVRVFTGHHSHEVPLYDWRLLFEVDRFVARRLANVVVAPSRQMGDTFVHVYGCQPENVIVIEHGLDLDRFDPERTDGTAVRRELGLEEKLVLGAIAKPHWVKNLDALVRAFASIATNRKEMHLVILGVGDLPWLQATVDDLGLSTRVTLLARRHDVPQMLAAFDVFVHPALAESFGFAIVEAMAMALPVIATPVGITPDVIEDGVSGIEIRGTDPDSIREAIIQALTWRDHWPQFGAEARRRAVQFTPQRWVRAYENLYQSRLALT
jgi:glycosyltransferase involved in cell wall biosynthesis